jgi:hypothetical protein
LIHGQPLVDEDAEGVRAFLEALHAQDACGLPLERHDWVEAYREQCAEFERLVFPVVHGDRRAEARRLFGEVETLVDFTPSLIHADLGPDIFCATVAHRWIDRGDMRAGDPALDYAWLLTGPRDGCRSRDGGRFYRLASGTRLITDHHEPASAY